MSTTHKCVFIVKSFGPESGYVNLKVFDTYDKAVKYSKQVDVQIPEGIEDEFVEIEELTLE